jgi:hypothetical protein
MATRGNFLVVSNFLVRNIEQYPRLVREQIYSSAAARKSID